MNYEDLKLGDEVWFMFGNRTQKGKILSMGYKDGHFSDKKYFYMILEFDGGSSTTLQSYGRPENDLCALTREELLAKL